MSATVVAQMPGGLFRKSVVVTEVKDLVMDLFYGRPMTMNAYQILVQYRGELYACYATDHGFSKRKVDTHALAEYL